MAYLDFTSIASKTVANRLILGRLWVKLRFAYLFYQKAEICGSMKLENELLN